MIAAKQMFINEVYEFSIVNFIYSVDKTFGVIKIIYFNRTGPRCYSAIFLTPVLANKMELFCT